MHRIRNHHPIQSFISPLHVIPFALGPARCVVVPTDSSDQPGQTAFLQQGGYEADYNQDIR